MLGLESLFVVSCGWGSNVSIKLGTDKNIPTITGEVFVSFDQSSTQTGICITNVKGELIALVDLQNKGMLAKDYIRLFNKWLNNNLKDCEIKQVVYEEANQNAKQAHSHKILNQLISIIEMWAANRGAKCDGINNGTWKKHYLKEPKFDGRRKETSKVKVAVQEKTLDLHPSLRGYVYSSGGKDSCDARGIMYGFINEWYYKGDTSRPQVNNMMPTYPIRKYNKSYFSQEEFVERMKANPKEARHVILLRYNDEFTLEDNCLRAINYYSNSFVILTPSTLKTIQLWSFDANRQADQDTVCYITR